MIEMQSEQLICPGCEQPVKSISKICDMCGLDFYEASRLIQEAFMEQAADREFMLEPVQPRIGEYLVNLDVLTAKQLEVALREQRRRLSLGRRTPLGHTLSDLGYVNLKTFEYYLALQALQLKLQLVVGRMELAAAMGRQEMVSASITEMKQNLLRFAAVIDGINTKSRRAVENDA